MQTWEIPGDARIVPCRSCGARIAFVLTPKGKQLPVDVDGATRGVAHFASCDDPKRFRKRERVKGPRSV